MAIFIYNDVKYKIVGHSIDGVYISSDERIKSGTVREIYGRLFYAVDWYDNTDWRLVEGQDTNLKSFQDKILDGRMIDYEFEINYYTIDTNRKAKCGDVIQFNGYMFTCTNAWTNFPFFSYTSVWSPITLNKTIQEESDIITKIKKKLLGVEDGQPTV